VEKYTGSLQGSKRSWNEADKARFNDLMVEVYNDQKRNGVRFNHRWKKRVAIAGIQEKGMIQQKDCGEDNL
jgi:hypothetical protein